MLLFAHTGISLGATMGFSSALKRVLPQDDGLEGNTAFLLRFAASVFQKVDYRLVLIGSMLPDIIDKPLGHILLADSLGNGRIFAHTLLFFLILLLLGIYRYWHFEGTGVIVMALASGGHLVLDEMWKNHQTLFWPLHGWSFPEGNYESWWKVVTGWMEGLQENPDVYIPEAMGLAILIPVGLELFRTRALIYFIRRGFLR